MDDHSEDTSTQPVKPDPTNTIRRLGSKESLFLSPSESWNLYRRNPWYMSWQQESWAMLFSLLCLIAVAIIMAWIDGKRLSIWHWAIQPNAVISVLIVSSKAALMISTASCVGQLKWTHFQRAPRRLRDLENFDDASRGAWGSLCLLFSRSGYLNVAVTLGCSVTVLVLAMETFGQQLLSFPERRVAVTNLTATFPVIQDFSPLPTWGGGFQFSDRLLQSRLGLMESIYGQTTDPPFDCPASLCSWDSHVTLGLCSTCQDISSTEGHCKVEIKTEHSDFRDYYDTTLECEYPTFDGDYNVSTTRLAKGVTSPDNYPDPNNASAWTYETAIDVATWHTDAYFNKGQPANAFNFSVIVANDTWERPQITTCALWYCAWVYENSSAQGQDFQAGTLNKYILGYDSIQRTDPSLRGNHDSSNFTFTGAGTGFPSDKHNDTFIVYGDPEFEMISHLSTILESSTMDYFRGSNETTAGLGEALLMNTNITALADRMATSITNVWRQYNSTPAAGTAWEAVAFIHVEWAWLALPAAAVIGAGAVLLLTLLQNRRVVLWKSSVLPYTFRPLDGWEDAEFDVETMEEIRDRAKEMKGQLKEDDWDRVRLIRS